MKSILIAEFKLLHRNTLVLISATFMPLLFCVGLFFLKNAFPGGLTGSVALMVFSICTIGLYITATTTLAERRQNFYLKKLLCTSVSPSSIIAGLLLPVIVVVIGQLIAVLGLLSFLATPPENLLVLVFSVFLTIVLMIASAFLTAAKTKSAAHAQTTTMPLFCLFFGVCVWATSFPNPRYEMLQQLLPGGATALLIQGAWNGVTISEAFAFSVITVIWSGIFLLLSTKIFHWEPNR